MYLSDDGDVLGMRYDNWKVVFMEQRRQGTLLIWGEPFTRCHSARSGLLVEDIEGHAADRELPSQRCVHHLRYG
jgi:hypothetical protein